MNIGLLSGNRMPYGKNDSQLTSYDQVGVEEGAIGIRDNLVNIQVNLYQTTVANFTAYKQSKNRRIHIF